MELERTRVEINQCAKTYPDGTRGLRPTDLTVEPGEVVALLGPSGCGKTTLLRLIAGLEAPNEGSRIAFGGTDVTRLPIEQRGIGMVFQHYALFPQMTVAANIGYGLKIRNVPEAERRRTVGEAHCGFEIGASQLGGQQGAIEGVACGRGVHRLYPKARNERLLLGVAAIDPLGA